MNTELLTLFSTANKQNKFIAEVDIDLFDISEHNPRKTQDPNHIEDLVSLIKKNGFDNTCAIKCYLENGRYKVFAGGNRLAASKIAGKKTLPVFLYEGYEPEEIWGMAYSDNEQAGTQKQLSVVDVWLDYRSKSEQGWTQQAIADSLGVSQRNVGYRIQYSKFPKTVLGLFSTNEILKEGHARELLSLAQCAKTNSWYNQETFLVEIIEGAIDANRKNEISANVFKKRVEQYNKAIKEVDKAFEILEKEWLESFLKEATEKKYRSSVILGKSIAVWQKKQAAAKQAAANEAQKELDKKKAEADEEAKQAEEKEKINKIIDKIILGDAREFSKTTPEETRLIFIDPPYGKDFQSNRREKSKKKSKIANDGNINTAVELTREVLQNGLDRIKNDVAILLWIDWENEPIFRDMLSSLGLTIKNSLVWDKNNHATGDLKCSFGNKHERIIFATRGRIELSTRLPDVLQGKKFLDSEHPTKKPIDLISKLIDVLTYEDDFVVDYFLGGGPTAYSALSLKRRFWGCELDKQNHTEALEHIIKIITKK